MRLCPFLFVFGKEMFSLSFWQILTLGGTIAGILGVFLTGYALINNRTLKREEALTRKVIEQEAVLTREVIEESREAMKQEAVLTREMIKETTRYIADLIERVNSNTMLVLERMERRLG